jgi:hypothetical protein
MIEIPEGQRCLLRDIDEPSVNLHEETAHVEYCLLRVYPRWTSRNCIYFILGTSVATASSKAYLSETRGRAAESFVDVLFVTPRDMDQFRSTRCDFGGG